MALGYAAFIGFMTQVKCFQQAGRSSCTAGGRGRRGRTGEGCRVQNRCESTGKDGILEWIHRKGRSREMKNIMIGSRGSKGGCKEIKDR